MALEIETKQRWEDAGQWMTLYGDMIRLNLTILERIERELTGWPLAAQRAARVDIALIETQMAQNYDRLDVWYRRLQPNPAP